MSNFLIIAALIVAAFVIFMIWRQDKIDADNLMVRLYKKAPEGEITDFHLAWFDFVNKRIVEIADKLGKKGEIISHEVNMEINRRAQIASLLKNARANGYAEFRPDDHKSISVEYNFDKDDLNTALQQRNLLAEALDDQLRWTGLGQCSSMSASPDKMDITFQVVDLKMAKAIIISALAEAGLEKYDVVA